MRFSEFDDDWKYYVTSSLLEFKNGINAEKERFGQGKKIVNYKDVYNNEQINSDLIQGLVEYNEIEYKRYSVIENDILFTRTSETIDEIGFTASVNTVDIDMIFSGFLLRGRPINKNLISPFSGYLFRTHSSRKEIIRKSSYTTRALTNGKLLSEVEVCIPTVKEQEKIGLFISEIDYKTELLSSKIENLKLFKKGFKQELINSYTTENSIEIKLKDILTEISDKSISNNQYEVLSSTKNGIHKQTDYFNREIASADNTGYKILKLGQFVMSPQNAWMGNYNINNDFEIGIVSPSYKIFNISEKISTTILSELTDTDRFRYDIVCSSEQGASVVRRNLNMPDFLDIKIRIPADTKKLTTVEKLLKKLNSKISDLEANLINLKQFTLVLYYNSLK